MPLTVPPPSAAPPPPQPAAIVRSIDHPSMALPPATTTTTLFVDGFDRAPAVVLGVARGTGYYPKRNRMEGGVTDMRGAPLHTLQDFLAGRAPYVSVALDKKLYRAGALAYGAKLRVPELEARYGRSIEFRAVDIGGAFTGKGFTRIDVCTSSRGASLDATLNGTLTLLRP